MNSVDAVLAKIEQQNRQILENGLSQEFKEKWSVKNNVGLWIIEKDTAQYLRNLIIEHKPVNILEIGTSVGYSAIKMAEVAADYGGKITTIEKENFKFQEAKENVKDSGLQNITLVNGDALQVMNELELDRFDLIFIDGNKSGYLPQFQKIENQAKSGCIVVADNVIDMHDRLQDFISYTAKAQSWSSEILNIGDGLLVAKKHAV
jgi:predicted O-methyltransferase YrrM